MSCGKSSTWALSPTCRAALRGRAEAVVRPDDADEVARVVGWCYERDAPIVPRDGAAARRWRSSPAGPPRAWRPPTRALWRWRDSVRVAVTSLRGGKLSEDVAVPVERLAHALERVAATGASHGFDSRAWVNPGKKTA